MIRATAPVSRVTNRDQIAWAANLQMEPTRPIACGIMWLWRAAHLKRYADGNGMHVLQLTALRTQP